MNIVGCCVCGVPCGGLFVCMWVGVGIDDVVCCCCDDCCMTYAWLGDCGGYGGGGDVLCMGEWDGVVVLWWFG